MIFKTEYMTDIWKLSPSWQSFNFALKSKHCRAVFELKDLLLTFTVTNLTLDWCRIRAKIKEMNTAK